MAAKTSSSAGRPLEREPPALGRADAVLGADRAAGGHDEAQHGVVDGLVVGVDTGDVDVQVAVADVPEQPAAGVGGDRRDRGRHRLDERRQRRRAGG